MHTCDRIIHTPGSTTMEYLSRLLYRWSSWISVLGVTLLYGLFITQIMAPHAIEMRSFAGDWGAPDGHLFYTPTELYAHISSWTAAGREHYVKFRLGLDPLWALTYTAFLITSISVALRRGLTEHDPRRLLNLAPLIPMAADLLENGLGILLVFALPTHLNWLAALMGLVSMTKWVSLTIAHLILLYSLVLAGRAVVRRGK
jgi:hypothetical protein